MKESEYLIHFDQKLTQRLLYLFIWDLVFEKFENNSRKFFSNIFLIVYPEFELYCTVHSHCFHVKMHQMNGIII